MKYASLRGMNDILPDETPLWQYIEKKFHEKFQKNGYFEIRTPIMEQTELFIRSIGDDTDIVGKEMYSFKDKKGRDISLRPEATASVVRAGIENSLINKDKPIKLYYIGPMFRYERPQSGRYRQFYQAGIEIIGGDDEGNNIVLSDFNVILSAVDYLSSIELRDLEININSIGCGECRPAYLADLKEFTSKHLDKLCSNCTARYNNSPLRVLDCKNPKCKEVLHEAPSLTEYICIDCEKNLNIVAISLRSLGNNVVRNTNLVRGLDYYTGMIFEIVSKDLGAQNALCGGGRYNKLVKDLGGPNVPAVGMAFGIERLISIIKAQKIDLPIKKEIELFIAIIGGMDAISKAYMVQRQLELSQIESRISPRTDNLSSQLKLANSIGAKKVLIIGEDEIKRDTFPLKDMSTGDQKEISLKDIEKELK
ncbi:MAG: histidine--tRNA ligase [Candidatus Margulisiibacteriota bacterium]